MTLHCYDVTLVLHFNFKIYPIIMLFFIELYSLITLGKSIDMKYKNVYISMTYYTYVTSRGSRPHVFQTNGPVPMSEVRVRVRKA